MSTSSTSLTFFLMIPTVTATSALCGPRPGRNPYENPRKSSSYKVSKIFFEIFVVLLPRDAVYSGSAAHGAPCALFVGFSGTMGLSDFSRSCITGLPTNVDCARFAMLVDAV